LTGRGKQALLLYYVIDNFPSTAE